MATSENYHDLLRREREKRGLKPPEQPSVRATTRMRSPRRSEGSKAGGKEYLIQDPEAFAGLIDTAIAHGYDGKRDRAAQALDIPPTTLRRVHLQKGDVIRHDTLLKLRRLVGRANAGALEAALLSPPARELLEDYDAWMTNEMHWIIFRHRRTAKSPALRSEMSSELGASRRLTHLRLIVGDSEDSAESLRIEHVQKLLSTLQRRFPSAWNRLNEALVKRGHFQRRALLSQLRVIAPMLDCLETKGIELEPSEWSEGDIRRFIKAGATREAILLNRETEMRRAQRIVFRS